MFICQQFFQKIISNKTIILRVIESFNVMGGCVLFIFDLLNIFFINFFKV